MEEDPLSGFEEKGKTAKGKRLFGGGAISGNKKRPEKQRDAVRTQRRLKEFDQAVIAEVSITTATGAGDTSTNGSSNQKRHQVLVDPPAHSAAGASAKGPIRHWTEEEKERLGFEILAAALKSIDGVQLSDFRALRRIGADSLDNLRRYFELKVHVGALPDEVRLEPSEMERAATARDDYFLAVVGGLEKELRQKSGSSPTR